MKKSTAYHLAQIAVLVSPTISPESKIKVLKVLIDDEGVAEFSEEQKAKRLAEEQKAKEEAAE